MSDPGSSPGSTGARADRLLCDEMLRRLGRWLRAAGYDAETVAAGTDDGAVLRIAERHGRHLLTRDRALAARARERGIEVIRVTADDLDRQAAELRRLAGVDWMRAPLSRCMMDNAVLVPAAPETALFGAGMTGSGIWYCPGCGRSYWAGSHTRRILDRLRGWGGGTRHREACGA